MDIKVFRIRDADYHVVLPIKQKGADNIVLKKDYSKEDKSIVVVYAGLRPSKIHTNLSEEEQEEYAKKVLLSLLEEDRPMALLLIKKIFTEIYRP